MALSPPPSPQMAASSTSHPSSFHQHVPIPPRLSLAGLSCLSHTISQQAQPTTKSDAATMRRQPRMSNDMKPSLLCHTRITRQQPSQPASLCLSPTTASHHLPPRPCLSLLPKQCNSITTTTTHNNDADDKTLPHTNCQNKAIAASLQQHDPAAHHLLHPKLGFPTCPNSHNPPTRIMMTSKSMKHSYVQRHSFLSPHHSSMKYGRSWASQQPSYTPEWA